MADARENPTSKNRTIAPKSEAEWVERFNALVPAPHGGPEQYDWAKLFLEYARSTQSEVASMKKFCESKQISVAAIQTRGGIGFWNAARRWVQRNALVKALGQRSTDVVARKYERELQLTDKLTTLMHRAADQMIRSTDRLPDGTNPPENPYMASAIKTLMESAKLLAETNMKLLGDERGDGSTTNVQVNILDAVRERNRQFGIQG